MTQTKVVVSERALFQRVNRKLKAADQRVYTARGFWADVTCSDSFYQS